MTPDKRGPSYPHCRRFHGRILWSVWGMLGTLTAEVAVGNTLSYICVGCQMRCRLVITVDDHRPVAVAGNRCNRALGLAQRRLKARAAELTLLLAVSGGTSRRVEARATEFVTPDVARAIGVAMRHVSVAAPVIAGEILVPDAAGLGIDLVALADVPAS